MTREAVESALAQTMTDHEIIVVDDGSTDGTTEALDREFGSRIRIVTKANGGVSTARNVGASSTAGRYIAYLDSDDLWAPEKLASFRAAIIATDGAGPTFYFSDFRRFEMTTGTFYSRSNTELYPRIFNHFTRTQGELYTATPLETFKCVINDYPFFPSTFVLSREIHDHLRWDPLVKFSEDFNFVCRVSELFPMVYIDKKLSVVRMHTDNKSANKAGKRTSHFATLETMTARAWSNPSRKREIRIAQGRKHRTAAVESYRCREWLPAAKHLLHCLLRPDYLLNVGRNFLSSPPHPVKQSSADSTT